MTDQMHVVDQDPTPPCQWVSLSLHDGLAAESVYDRSHHLDRMNSTFWQRCRAAFGRNGFHYATALDVLDDAKRCLLVPVDPEAIKRKRFVRNLRVGLADAIGYTLPRAPEALPVLIPSHVWDHAKIDWDKAKVSGAGFTFVHVRILMAASVYDAHNPPYLPEVLGDLAMFAPSDDKRRKLNIPAQTIPEDMPRAATESGAADIAPKAPVGRKSFRPDIVDAFETIDKNPHWSNKELARAIRDHVMQKQGLTSDAGLGNDAIIKILRPLWHDFKNPPHAN